jgi:hypothetical protein
MQVYAVGGHQGGGLLEEGKSPLRPTPQQSPPKHAALSPRPVRCPFASTLVGRTCEV